MAATNTEENIDSINHVNADSVSATRNLTVANASTPLPVYVAIEGPPTTVRSSCRPYQLKFWIDLIPAFTAGFSTRAQLSKC